MACLAGLSVYYFPSEKSTITQVSTSNMTSPSSISLTITNRSVSYSTESVNSSCTTSQVTSTIPPDVAVLPVLIGVYVNGSIANGIESFNVAADSHSILNITALYPWQFVNDTGACITITFSIHLGGIPNWLQVSPGNSSVAMPYGNVSSIDLTISTDQSAPAGSSGTFEVVTHYVDPASGIATNTDTHIEIVAS